jgi:hypothetical protein
MRIYQRIGRRFWGQIFACEIRQAARREATNRPPRLGDELCSGDPVPLLGGQRHLHRNARCPCGRGRKYKRCCGRRQERGSSASVRHTDARCNAVVRKKRGQVTGPRTPVRAGRTDRTSRAKSATSCKRGSDQLIELDRQGHQLGHPRHTHAAAEGLPESPETSRSGVATLFEESRFGATGSLC